MCICLHCTTDLEEVSSALVEHVDAAPGVGAVLGFIDHGQVEGAVHGAAKPREYPLYTARPAGKDTWQTGGQANGQADG